MPNPAENIPISGSQVPPEFFPIPPRGGDRFFGISRSSYYDLEKRGLLRLVRLRKPGNLHGRVLVPYAATLALIRRLSQKDGPGDTPAAA
jgi:hypothetical protein